MSLFVRLTAWTEYVGGQLSAAAVDERFDAESLDRIKAVAAVRNKTEKTVTAQKAAALDDPDVQVAQDKANASYAFRKMTEAVYNATDRKSQVVSRELTRRVGRHDRDSRSERYGVGR